MNSRIRNKQSQRTGAMAERLCEIALRQAGYRLVEKVEAPRTKTGIYLRTCSGDFRAVGDEGRSILVECKWRDQPHLTPCCFADHQRKSLIEHHKAGGVSIIAHVTPRGCRLIYWPEALEILTPASDRIAAGREEDHG